MSGYTASEIDRLFDEAPHEPNRLRRWLVEKTVKYSERLSKKQPEEGHVVKEKVRYSYRYRARSLAPVYRSVRFYMYDPDGPHKNEEMDLWVLHGDEKAAPILYCPKRCAFVAREDDGYRALHPEELLRVLGATDYEGHRPAAIKALTLLIDAAA